MLRVIATVAAAAALCALSAAPAGAQTPEPPATCLPVPNCINEAFTTAEEVVDFVQGLPTWDPSLQGVVQEVIDKLQCPGSCGPSTQEVLDELCWILFGTDGCVTVREQAER